MFSIASSRSEQTRTIPLSFSLFPLLLSLSLPLSILQFLLSTPSMPAKTAYNVTADKLFSLRGSFSFKKSASYFPRCTLASCVARNYTLASFSARERPYLRIQSRGHPFSRSPRNFISSLFNHLRATPSPRMLFSTLPPSRSDSPELFQGAARGGGYLYTSRSLARSPRETSEAPMRRGNTEYHRQTLISFRRGQTVPMPDLTFVNPHVLSIVLRRVEFE